MQTVAYNVMASFRDNLRDSSFVFDEITFSNIKKQTLKGPLVVTRMFCQQEDFLGESKNVAAGLQNWTVTIAHSCRRVAG